MPTAAGFAQTTRAPPDSSVPGDEVLEGVTQSQPSSGLASRDSLGSEREDEWTPPLEGASEEVVSASASVPQWKPAIPGKHRADESTLTATGPNGQASTVEKGGEAEVSHENDAETEDALLNWKWVPSSPAESETQSPVNMNIDVDDTRNSVDMEMSQGDSPDASTMDPESLPDSVSTVGVGDSLEETQSPDISSLRCLVPSCSCSQYTGDRQCRGCKHSRIAHELLTETDVNAARKNKDEIKCLQCPCKSFTAKKKIATMFGWRSSTGSSSIAQRCNKCDHPEEDHRVQSRRDREMAAMESAALEHGCISDSCSCSGYQKDPLKQRTSMSMTDDPKCSGCQHSVALHRDLTPIEEKAFDRLRKSRHTRCRSDKPAQRGGMSSFVKAGAARPMARSSETNSPYAPVDYIEREDLAAMTSHNRTESLILDTKSAVAEPQCTCPGFVGCKQHILVKSLVGLLDEEAEKLVGESLCISCGHQLSHHRSPTVEESRNQIAAQFARAAATDHCEFRPRFNSDCPPLVFISGVDSEAGSAAVMVAEGHRVFAQTVLDENTDAGEVRTTRATRLIRAVKKRVAGRDVSVRSAGQIVADRTPNSLDPRDSECGAASAGTSPTRQSPVFKGAPARDNISCLSAGPDGLFVAVCNDLSTSIVRHGEKAPRTDPALEVTHLGTAPLTRRACSPICVTLASVNSDAKAIVTVACGDAFAFRSATPTKDELVNPARSSTQTWQREQLVDGDVASVLEYGPNQRLLAVGTTEAQVRVFCTRLGGKSPIMKLSSSASVSYGRIICLLWAPDESAFCTGSEDDAITVFGVSVKTPQTEKKGMAGFIQKAQWPTVTVTPLRVLRAHSSFVSALSLCTGDAGMLVLSGGYDGKICCWDAEEVFSPTSPDEAASQAASQATSQTDSETIEVTALGDCDIEPLCAFEVRPGEAAIESIYSAMDFRRVQNRGVKQRSQAAVVAVVLRFGSNRAVVGIRLPLRVSTFACPGFGDFLLPDNKLVSDDRLSDNEDDSLLGKSSSRHFGSPASVSNHHPGLNSPERHSSASSKRLLRRRTSSVSSDDDLPAPPSQLRTPSTSVSRVKRPALSFVSATSKRPRSARRISESSDDETDALRESDQDETPPAAANTDHLNPNETGKTPGLAVSKGSKSLLETYEASNCGFGVRTTAKSESKEPSRLVTGSGVSGKMSPKANASAGSGRKGSSGNVTSAKMNGKAKTTLPSRAMEVDMAKKEVSTTECGVSARKASKEDAKRIFSQFGMCGMDDYSPLSPTNKPELFVRKRELPDEDASESTTKRIRKEQTSSLAEEWIPAATELVWVQYKSLPDWPSILVERASKKNATKRTRAWIVQFLGDGTQAEVAESYVTRFEPNSVRFDSLVQAGLTAMQHNKDCALFKKAYEHARQIHEAGGKADHVPLSSVFFE